MMDEFYHQMQRLASGHQVLDISGALLGRVGDVSHDRFEVMTSRGLVSLRPDCLFTVSNGTAVLICQREHIHRYAAGA